ncbi:MAG TPA: hypothetical protein VKU00_02185 [Chthonomonadaceae bacterium]|nr:hypothetical protein [Chthonomonadaceae bacterium]
MAVPSILEGTWEEIKQHEEDLAGRRFRLILLSEDNENIQKNTPTTIKATKEPKQLRGLGRFAHVPGGSEAFAQEKQIEIAREDRMRP